MVGYGDFNDIADASEKEGSNNPKQYQIMAFQSMLNNCGLTDLETKGQRFTWLNKRTHDHFIMKRIDKAYSSAARRETFPQALVLVELAIGFDHCPLILDTDLSPRKVNQPFRFESMWTTEEECELIISDAWKEEVLGSNSF